MKGVAAILDENVEQLVGAVRQCGGGGGGARLRYVKCEHGDVGISMVNESNHLDRSFAGTGRGGGVSGSGERARGGRADVLAFFVLIKSAISRSRERLGSWREGSHARSVRRRQRAVQRSNSGDEPV